MKKEAGRVFISDCEGPISKNDNAFELAAHFIPKGEKFFALISKYDDVLADIVKRPGYKAGDTLKLILPFFKAYGVTDAKMMKYSQQNILLMPYAKQALEHISSFIPVFIVSTSYEHYGKALCKTIGFPYKNVYCTKLTLNKYEITQNEKQKLREIAEEITALPMIEIPENAKTVEDFPEKHRATIQRLDEIFWEEIVKMEIGKILSEVNPIGGREKARAVKEIAEKCGVDLKNVMYVGDSITDVEPFQLVRSAGGLTVSFNGNRYAVREAEITVLSGNAAVTAVLAQVFHSHGRKRVLWFAENWNVENLRSLKLPSRLMKHLLSSHPQGLPKIKIVTCQNMEIMTKESTEFRKKVRGEVIGRLG